MSFFLILPYYLVWHYGQALKDIKNIWKDFIFFVYNFFSIPLLLSTLFSPWERVQDAYSKDLGMVFQTFIFNTIMRVVGITLRLVFVVIGSVSIIALVFLGIVFYIIWFFLPILVLNVAIWGIKELSF